MRRFGNLGPPYGTPLRGAFTAKHHITCQPQKPYTLSPKTHPPHLHEVTKRLRWEDALGTK